MNRRNLPPPIAYFLTVIIHNLEIIRRIIKGRLLRYDSRTPDPDEEEEEEEEEVRMYVCLVLIRVLIYISINHQGMRTIYQNIYLR
jgi:hypothetical protein